MDHRQVGGGRGRPGQAARKLRRFVAGIVVFVAVRRRERLRDADREELQFHREKKRWSERGQQ
jgi:hypothetical protein